MISYILAGLAIVVFAMLYRKFGATPEDAASDATFNVSGSGEKAHDIKRETRTVETDLKDVVADAKSLEAVAEKFPGFVPDAFIEFAKSVLVAILDAFVKPDRKKLKTMLTTAAYRRFCEQIDKRELSKLHQKINIEHKKATIKNAELLANKARLVIAMHVSQMSAIYNADGESVDNPNELSRDVVHTWQFERKYESDDWLLSNTSAAEA